MKNVLIISTSDPFLNAGRVALDLFRGLKENKDFSVELLVRYSREKEKGIVTYYSTIGLYVQKIKAKFFSYWRSKKIVSDPDYYFFDFDHTKNIHNSKKLLKRTSTKPDVILLLFMYKFISFRNIRELHELTGAHIIMYPLDMALFTGGCHYSWDCLGYTSSCGKCPALFSNDHLDQSHRNLIFKQQQIADVSMTVIACNKQIFKQINASSIFQNKKIIDGMYFETDTTIFYKRDVFECRRYFGLAENKLVFFFGAVSLREKRKGMQILDESLLILKESLVERKIDLSRILLLVAGDDYKESHTGFEVKYLGHVSDVSVLAKAYSAADFFICPSIEDTGPTMVLQSIFCNTPVIGFKNGYIDEFIIDGKNGLVASEKNKNWLGDALIRSTSVTTQEHLNMRQDLGLISASISKNTLKDKVAKLIREI